MESSGRRGWGRDVNRLVTLDEAAAGSIRVKCVGFGVCTYRFKS